MNQPILGIIGGGQLGSMLSEAANKVDIKTVTNNKWQHNYCC